MRLETCSLSKWISSISREKIKVSVVWKVGKSARKLGGGGIQSFAALLCCANLPPNCTNAVALLLVQCLPAAICCRSSCPSCQCHNLSVCSLCRNPSQQQSLVNVDKLSNCANNGWLPGFRLCYGTAICPVTAYSADPGWPGKPAKSACNKAK